MENFIGKKINSKESNNLELIKYFETVKTNIEKNTYLDKPQYNKKPNSNESNQLKKIKSITKYTQISPIEIFYKMKYENFHKIHDDEEKCTICLDTFYEIDKNTTLNEAITKHENYHLTQ
jgi:hypothetical protein